MARTLTSRESGKIGCFGIFLITLALFLAAGAIGGYVIYTKGKGLALHAAASAVELSAGSMLEGFGFPESERNDIMKPVKALASEIRAGNVGIAQGAAIAENLNGIVVSAAVLARGFDKLHIESTELELKEKELIRGYLMRFARGLAEETIPRSKLGEINSIISSSTTDANGTVHIEYKESLTNQELMQCFQVFMDSVKAARVPDTPYQIDLKGALQEAIDTGMQAPKSTDPS
jgi:hypothetical protein